MDLQLSVAVGDYDRTRALFDRTVRIDGVEPTYLRLEPEEMFFRAFRHAEFDVCELSFSSFVVETSHDRSPYVGIPVFLSRAFRHSSFYVRTDCGIERPEDLRGKRVGVGEYQLTACVWARILLEEEFGVRPNEVRWIRGGVEAPDRPEKIRVSLPPDISVVEAPKGVSINEMLKCGDLDAFIGPRSPPCFDEGHPQIRRLFQNTGAAASEFYRATKVFPIMHILGVRRDLVNAHPWLPATLMKAFARAKEVALVRLGDTSAPKVTLPFLEEQLESARTLMGQDFWPYGINSSRHVLEKFLMHHHRQGLSHRLVEIKEIFHPSTFEVAVI